MRISYLSGLAAATVLAGAFASPAFAQPEPDMPPVPKIRAAKPAPNFEAMLSILDKMFPPQPEPDPARLVLARTSVQAMWPDGAYGRMMSGFMSNMFNGVMQMKPADFDALSNKAGKKTSAALDSRSLHDQVAAKDPYFDQRMTAMRGVMDEEFGKISALVDPRMREGLARSMARRFDGRQLADINAFFATPSGRALASQYMQLWFEPDTLRSMMRALPEMMKLMPDAMEKFKAANDKFPKPPKSAPAKH
ncbi:MAG TPA: hypothetical protein VF750_06735 [Sphingomicrobium sp.]